MDIAKSEIFRNFTILNKVLLFSIKLNKTAVQSVRIIDARQELETVSATSVMTVLKLEIA